MPANSAGLVYEVFCRRRRGAPLEHVGSLTATDERMARIHAAQIWGRRGETDQLWVVPRTRISVVAPGARVVGHEVLRNASTWGRHGGGGGPRRA